MRTSSVGLVLCALALGCGDASTGLTEATAAPSVSVGSVTVTRKNLVEAVFGVTRQNDLGPFGPLN